MAKTMHAAVVHHLGQPLVLREMPIPSPGPGQILVKTEACGVCHTDLHAAKGDWPAKPTLPFIPGHEGIGIVCAMGPGVTAVKEGDRVGVPWLFSACGHCEHCLSAWETVCGSAEFGGYTRNGGFAEYILADPDYVAHVPAGLAARAAAPIICAGVTSYKGIKVTEARPGEWLLVSGAGGLGHLAIQYGKAMGLLVCAVDVDDGKLAHAARLGADLVVNASEGDPVAAVRQGTGGGAHGVLITAPSLGAFQQGIGMTRKRGTCALVGLPPGDFPLPLFDVVAKCITVRGSFVGTRQDMAEALAFAADGRVHADIELQPLSAINDVFGRLERGAVPSRVVIDFPGVGMNGAALTAGDVMTRDVATVIADSPLHAAIRLMLDRRVSGLPVLDGTGMLVGMLTEGDLLRRVELGTEEHRSGWRAFLRGPDRLAADYVVTHSRVVRDVMTAAALTVDVAAPLAEVVTLMQARRVKRVPVLSGHRLVGIVSRSDLLRQLAESLPAPTAGESDDAIRDGILTEFRRQSWPVETIKVAVTAGVVDLEGVIFEISQRAAIRVAVENVPGVISVRDHITWVEPYSGMTDPP